MTEDGLKAATAGTTEHRDIQARRVTNGYVLSATRRFVEDNGSTRLSFAIETIATDWDMGIADIGRFLDTAGIDTPVAV